MKSNQFSKLKLTSLAACLAVGVLANPANATITLYEKGALKYKLKADWQIQANQDVGNDQDLTLEYDDLELKNIITYDLGNGLTAFGEVHFSFNDQADDLTTSSTATDSNDDTVTVSRDRGTKLEEAFIGFDFGESKIAFGKTNSAGDEFGVEKAYEKVGVPEDGFEDTADKGDDLIRYDGSFGSINVASSYEIESESESSGSESFFDIYGSVKVAGVKIAAAYMDYKGSPDADSTDVAGISVSYGIGTVDFGADFSTIDDGSSDDTEIYNIVAGIKVGPTGYIGAGINNVDDGSDDVSGWYANYTYKFAQAKNVRLLAEIGDNDADDTDIGYLVGVRILL